MTELSAEQREQMLHALGGRLFKNRREHYVTYARSEVWDPLVDIGLATRTKYGDDGWLYRITPNGIVRLRKELPPDGLKAWSIKFADLPVLTVRAKSLSSAKALALSTYAVYSDITFGGALKHVQWVRRASWADRLGCYGDSDLLTSQECEAR